MSIVLSTLIDLRDYPINKIEVGSLWERGHKHWPFTYQSGAPMSRTTYLYHSCSPAGTSILFAAISSTWYAFVKEFFRWSLVRWSILKIIGVHSKSIISKRIPNFYFLGFSKICLYNKFIVYPWKVSKQHSDGLGFIF